jgi:hypothetical protein
VRPPLSEHEAKAKVKADRALGGRTDVRVPDICFSAKYCLMLSHVAFRRPLDGGALSDSNSANYEFYYRLTLKYTANEDV